MTGEIFVFLESLLPPQLIIFLLGLAAGLYLGGKFSPTRYAYLTARLNAETAERKERWKNQKRADRLRAKELAEEAAERNRLFLVFGIYWDRDLQPHCPICKTPLPPFEKRAGMVHPVSFCCKCRDNMPLQSPFGDDAGKLREEVAEYIRTH